MKAESRDFRSYFEKRGSKALAGATTYETSPYTGSDVDYVTVSRSAAEVLDHT